MSIKQELSDELDILILAWVKRKLESDYRDFSPRALLGRLFDLYTDYYKLNPFWGYDLANLTLACETLFNDRTNCESEILRRII